jgi:hypothetical protein
MAAAGATANGSSRNLRSKSSRPQKKPPNDQQSFHMFHCNFERLIDRTPSTAYTPTLSCGCLVKSGTASAARVSKTNADF